MNAKENLLRAIRRQYPRWISDGMENTVFISPPIITRPRTAGRDSWNVKWDCNAGGTFPAAGSFVITDLYKWREQVNFPNLDSCDWSRFTFGWGGQGQPLSLHDINREEYLLSGVIELSLFERSYLLMGMEEALMAYVAEPELMDELLEAIADFNIAMIQRFDNIADLDMIWYGDDWGTQQNLFLPPDVWRRTVGKHTKRTYHCMKERGIIINQHSCGKIEAIFPDIVEMGVDIWNPCQPCNDLAKLKRVYGDRVTFCGGIDSQFVLDRPGVTPEEVRAEVRKRIDEMAKGGGYIAAPSHGVPYRPEIIEAMKDEIHVYGRAFYLAKDDI